MVRVVIQPAERREGTPVAWEFNRVRRHAAAIELCLESGPAPCAVPGSVHENDSSRYCRVGVGHLSNVGAAASSFQLLRGLIEKRCDADICRSSLGIYLCRDPSDTRSLRQPWHQLHADPIACEHSRQAEAVVGIQVGDREIRAHCILVENVEAVAGLDPAFQIRLHQGLSLVAGGLLNWQPPRCLPLLRLLHALRLPPLPRSLRTRRQLGL